MIGKSAMKKPIDSFATCHISCGSVENVRSLGRLQLRPYFGHFSGMWITFDVRKSLDSAGNHKIKVKIDGCPNPSTIHLRTHQSPLDLTKAMARIKLKDICLQYVHSLASPNFELKQNPKSLSFLCEKTILLNLNEVNSSLLPSISFSHLNPSTFCTQDVIVKVWFGSSSFPTRIERIKVRQGISIAELQWMLCSKLSMQIEPSRLDLYDYRSMEKLSEKAYLTPNQVIFHCVILSSVIKDSIIVSLVGQDIEQIKVEPNSMTLNEFQAKIKEKFALGSSSFIYIPQIHQNKKMNHWNQVTMGAILDKSTTSLIDSRRRNLPIVDSIPLTLLKYEEISMYMLTLSELKLLSSNLVCAYEVTGPTIPISYRTSTSIGKGEFSLISDRPHAVSINVNWSVGTLLKYLEDISHFPCEDISYGGSILQHSSLLHEHFTGCHWKTKQSGLNQIDFIGPRGDIPKVVNNSVAV